MKLTAMFAVLSMGATALLGFGCQATDDGDGDEVFDELVEEGEVEVDEQTAICQDIVFTFTPTVLCPYNVHLTCGPSTCVTDRYLAFTPPTPGQPGGGTTCKTGATTCSDPHCPPCP